jgi:hypothetical protein
MTYRTGNPTLRGVVNRIDSRAYPGEQPAIENNGRAVRLKKGKGADGETIYEIRTRPVGKGREWNFANRIAQERALVERFEKEIDTRCGKGMGKKLTKSVGAYDKFLNPKLDAGQLAKLQKRADQIEKVGPPPKGMRAEFDANDDLVWVGRETLNTQSIESMRKDLIAEFSGGFAKLKVSRIDLGANVVVFAEQFEADKNRSDMILEEHYQQTKLRDEKEENIKQKLLIYMGGNANAASNATVVMSQAAFGCFDVPYSTQTKTVTGDQSDLSKNHENANRLLFTAAKQHLNYIFSFESHRALNVISVDGGPNVHLDGEKSSRRCVFGLKMSHSDLSDGVADNIKFVGKPYVEYSVYPTHKDPAP